MYKRRVVSVLITGIFTCSTFLSSANASPETIYTTSEKETVTSGITLEKITKLTSEGWLNICVLRADLSNSNVGVDTITSNDSIQNAENTKVLAESQNAVAAINAGFFNWMGKSKSVYPDGPVVEDGEIISAANEYNRYNDSMATFSVDNLNNVFYDYWKTDITLEAPNKKSVVVNQYNKPSSNYTDYTIIDKKWSDMTIGVSDSYTDIIEMFVKDGKVMEIRKGLPATKVPQNGYVVITRTEGEAFLRDNFKIGDTVNFSISTNPDWNKFKTAVTGSAILVKNGEIPGKFSFNIAGRQPRTAVGSSKDGKELFLVSVDGRQKSSIGMTQTELAQFMVDIGAYNALNLDGGGSTTMVSREFGANYLEIINSPSDGLPRKVSTALGLFSLAPPSELNRLTFDNHEENIFVNTSIELDVKGFDKYDNPTEISTDKLTYAVSGVDGFFKGNTFYPKTTGKALIKATFDNIETSFEVNILNSPTELYLNNKELKITKGDSKSITLSGRNKEGYQIDIEPTDVEWKISDDFGYMDNGVFKALKVGQGFIEASIGDTKAYCSVVVNEESTQLMDSFESSNGTFLSFPVSVKGSYEISNEQNHSGSFSGKLSYDFTDTKGTRAAYYVLSDNGMELPKNTTKVGIWVYNQVPNPNWLRAEVKNSSDNKELLDLTRGMDWTGWKYLEVSTSGIDLLSKLTRIYMVQPNPVSDSGSIYLDDLSFSCSASSDASEVKLPEDSKFTDEADRTVTYLKSNESFRFSVFGESREPATDIEKSISKSFVDKINKYIEIGTFTGIGTHSITNSLVVPSVATGGGYKSFDMVNSRFIQLDSSQKSLRLTDTKQWPWLIKQLETSVDKNVFVFLDVSPKAFSDELEGNLLIDMLEKQSQKSGKNVWVFYKGDQNSSYTKNGVKFFSLAGFDLKGITQDTSLAKYLLVTVMGDEVTFRFKPIL